MRTVVGIDLGGTNVQGARVDGDGSILEKSRLPAEVEEGGEHLVAVMAEVGKRLKGDGTLAVGVCSPGIIDYEKGMSVSEAVNIPDWDGMEIARRMQDALSLPCFVDNDANVAALGEAWVGAGAGEKVVLMLTLGTGIGGGCIVDGRVYRGKSNMVSEFGHISVDAHGRVCACGNQGCIEVYASANAVAARAREYLLGRHKSSMLKAAGGDIGGVDAKLVCDEAREGDALASRVLDECCVYLAAGIGNLINAYNPSVVILAGGMSLAGDVLTGRLERELASGRAYPPILADCRLTVSKLGDDAGVVGAAKLAWNALERAPRA